MKFAILFFLGTLLSGCNDRAVESNLTPEQKVLVEKGKTVYLTYCIACHNMDPHLSGSVGPDLHGSSLELVTARVLRAEYPPNYKPKRTTQQMAPFEDLKDDIPAIHAFLNQ